MLLGTFSTGMWAGGALINVDYFVHNIVLLWQFFETPIQLISKSENEQAKMKAVVAEKQEGEWKLIDKPIPEPEQGQVRVKSMVMALNPV